MNPTLCPGTQHGNASAYTKFGCRCPEARRDRKYQDYRRAHGRPMTVDATGTRRRLRALMALGWPGRTIMTEMGWPGAALGAQLYQQARVHEDTARRVADVYERLSCQRGPSERSRSRAAAKGWPLPLAWDDDTIDDPAAEPYTCSSATSRATPSDLDEIAIERAMTGDPVQLTRHERREAVRRLHARDHSYNEIAARLHTYQRIVHRDLVTLGLAGTAASTDASTPVHSTDPVLCTPTGTPLLISVAPQQETAASDVDIETTADELWTPGNCRGTEQGLSA